MGRCNPGYPPGLHRLPPRPAPRAPFGLPLRGARPGSFAAARPAVGGGLPRRRLRGISGMRPHWAPYAPHGPARLRRRCRLRSGLRLRRRQTPPLRCGPCLLGAPGARPAKPAGPPASALSAARGRPPLGPRHSPRTPAAAAAGTPGPWAGFARPPVSGPPPAPGLPLPSLRAPCGCPALRAGSPLGLSGGRLRRRAGPPLPVRGRFASPAGLRPGPRGSRRRGKAACGRLCTPRPAGVKRSRAKVKVKGTSGPGWRPGPPWGSWLLFSLRPECRMPAATIGLQSFGPLA